MFERVLRGITPTADVVRPLVPAGFLLAGDEPYIPEVTSRTRFLRVEGNNLSTHAGLAIPARRPAFMSKPNPGELAAVLMLSPVVTTVAMSGSSYPRNLKLNPWVCRAIPCSAFDRLDLNMLVVPLSPVRIWPLVVAVPCSAAPEVTDGPPPCRSHAVD